MRNKLMLEIVRLFKVVTKRIIDKIQIDQKIMFNIFMSILVLNNEEKT